MDIHIPHTQPKRGVFAAVHQFLRVIDRYRLIPKHFLLASKVRQWISVAKQNSQNNPKGWQLEIRQGVDQSAKLQGIFESDPTTETKRRTHQPALKIGAILSNS